MPATSRAAALFFDDQLRDDPAVESDAIVAV